MLLNCIFEARVSRAFRIIQIDIRIPVMITLWSASYCINAWLLQVIIWRTSLRMWASLRCNIPSTTPATSSASSYPTVGVVCLPLCITLFAVSQEETLVCEGYFETNGTVDMGKHTSQSHYLRFRDNSYLWRCFRKKQLSAVCGLDLMWWNLNIISNATPRIPQLRRSL